MFFQALETKLASFRNYVKDNPQSSAKTGATQSPLSSPRYFKHDFCFHW